MKKLLWALHFLAAFQLVSAQNTFPSMGNVGIGASNPSTLLSITPSALGSKISLFDGSTPSDFYGFGISDNQLNYHVNTQIDNHVFFATGRNGNGVELMRIKGNGSVGIGTPNPPSGYKLAIAGNMIAEQVKVKLQASGWPDYVFGSSYRLPSLQQTEAFIKANGHLPEIPSAKQVEKEGLDLGGNQALLLKKIEELTLHIIEINKKLEILEKQSKNKKRKAVK